MVYYEYTLVFPQDASETAFEIATAELAELGFDSFSEEANELHAYIPESEYLLFEQAITDYLNEARHPYTARKIADDTNWNSAWESNFSPVEVDSRCRVRATFHEPQPGVEHEIVITPKMSFGTGHHATTHLMLSAMLDRSFAGQAGLDMGSGTGVLAILAARLGAAHVDAVDVDEWAFENSIENFQQNGVSGRVTPILGDAAAIVGKRYDFILANINRNILLHDMAAYAACLNPGGTLFMSGFLEVDIPAIVNKAEPLGLHKERQNLREGWAMVVCKK